ncbi:hypothetical protein M3B46_05930 [Sphingobacterium daejeonense]|uniref:hypothetical protein n=1 Tax=Sphingobacterium daejeonense TaxID=371142 RepID=UPI0021A3838A|nr:hypothetical protein [Sphingobacterium daejeonense]MCT1530526.1 hypothetical protein [Sphingobacterium daejeonense]
MKTYPFKDLTIELLDEPNYNVGSSDNNFNYSKHYFGDNAIDYCSSKHGIKIYKDFQIIDSCIIIGSGGVTCIHQNSSLIDKEQILVCCGDTIFCVSLSNLELKWKTKADQATCFKILQQREDYIVHGELQISKLDKNGKIRWEFGGEDIFVCIDSDEEFKIENDGILLTDLSKTKYKIDFDGNLIALNNMGS